MRYPLQTVIDALLPARRDVAAAACGERALPWRPASASGPPARPVDEPRPLVRIWRESLDRLERAHLQFDAVSGVLPPDGPGRIERIQTLDSFVAELSGAEEQLGHCLGGHHGATAPAAHTHTHRRGRRKHKRRRCGGRR